MLVLTSQKKKEVLVLVITKPKQRLNDGQDVAQCVSFKIQLPYKASRVFSIIQLYSLVRTVDRAYILYF